LARSYVKGRTTRHKKKGFKRKTPPRHGHCRYCGYDPRFKGYKRSGIINDFKFDIIPFIGWVLKNEEF